MRIGVNCYLLQPHIGGLKQYFLTLFRELLEHDRDNEYVFFWFAHNEAELARLGTDAWRRGAVRLADQREVLAHRERIDLYFCPFGALYPRPLPLPTVVTLVDIQEVFHPEFFTAEDRYNRDLHFPSSTRMADGVVTISEFSRQTLVKHHRLDPAKVTVAHLSADARYFRADREGTAPAVPLPRDFVFYPANFWKHKNHDVLLQALRLLRSERGLDVELVLTGFEQPNGYPLAAKAVEHGVEKHVHVLGYVTVEELVYLYRRARLLAFPSLFEGFGIPLVEAMAAGCPVVAANGTSIPEVTGDAAELFDPNSPGALADAIGRLWRDDARRRELVARGRRRAEHFTPAATARAHLDAFTRAVDAYSRGRYLWNRWAFQPYHRARVELRWWEHGGRERLRGWLAGRRLELRQRLGRR